MSRSNLVPKLHCASSDNPNASFYYISRCFWNGIEGYSPKTACGSVFDSAALGIHESPAVVAPQLQGRLRPLR